MSQTLFDRREVTKAQRLMEEGVAVGLGSFALKIIANRVPVIGGIVGGVAALGEVVGIGLVMAGVYGSIDSPLTQESQPTPVFDTNATLPTRL